MRLFIRTGTPGHGVGCGCCRRLPAQCNLFLDQIRIRSQHPAYPNAIVILGWDMAFRFYGVGVLCFFIGVPLPSSFLSA